MSAEAALGKQRKSLIGNKRHCIVGLYTCKVVIWQLGGFYM